jgi:hypothetical protein
VHYEWSRLAKIGAAAALAVGAGRALPETAPLLGLLARGAAMVGSYGVLLYATGFFSPAELGLLLSLRDRALARRASRTTSAPPADQLEMAGDIVSTTADPPFDESDAAESATTTTPGSRPPHD